MSRFFGVFVSRWFHHGPWVIVTAPGFLVVLLYAITVCCYAIRDIGTALVGCHSLGGWACFLFLVFPFTICFPISMAFGLVLGLPGSYSTLRAAHSRIVALIKLVGYVIGFVVINAVLQTIGELVLAVITDRR